MAPLARPTIEDKFARWHRIYYAVRDEIVSPAMRKAVAELTTNVSAADESGTVSPAVIRLYQQLAEIVSAGDRQAAHVAAELVQNTRDD